MSGKTLSEYAEEKMLELFAHHEHEVGSRASGPRAGRQVTDCITYVKNVLGYAYDSAGKPEIAREVRKFTEGTSLAQYLVRQGWRAHYWSPDPRNPRDGSSEHPVSFNKALQTNVYYGIPVSGFVVNYNRTGASSGCSVKAPASCDAVFKRLGQVKFAFGIARGGAHTFLYSSGMVYEVHWDEKPSLYERSPFGSYPWLSGLLLIPPGDPFTSETAAALRQHPFGASSECLKSDTEIREWLTRVDKGVIQALPTQEKVRLVNRLLDGWLSDADVRGIETLCRNAANPQELGAIRAAVEHRMTSITDHGQRLRVRSALQGL